MEFILITPYNERDDFPFELNNPRKCSIRLEKIEYSYLYYFLTKGCAS